MSDSEDETVDHCINMPPKETNIHASIKKVEWKHTPASLELRLAGEVCEKMAHSLEIALSHLQDADVEQIVISIDSTGGDAYAALRIVDLIDALDIHVTTVVVSKAMSGAAIIFSAGDERVMHPNAVVMLHVVRNHNGGGVETLPETRMDVGESERVNELFCEILAKNTKKNKKGFCNLSVTMSCQPKNIHNLQYSKYSLESEKTLPENLKYS